jgi:hypothetical protein
VLRQRSRDAGVEAAIQNVKFFYADLRFLRDGDLCDGLADVAVHVYSLGHCESQRK